MEALGATSAIVGLAIPLEANDPHFSGWFDSLADSFDSFFQAPGGQLTRVRDDVTAVGFEAGVSRAANFGDIMRLIIYKKL